MFFAALAAGFAAFLGVFLFGKPLLQGATRDQKRAASRLRSWDSPEATPVEQEPAKDSLGGVRNSVQVIGRLLAPANRKRLESLGTRLALAGYRNASAVFYFTGLQLVLVIAAGLMLGGIAAISGARWPMILLGGSAGAAAGLIAPSLVLGTQIRKRQRRLRHAFPDALDILVLSIEGGASVNAAITWVAEEIRPIQPLLGAEMAIVQQEIQLGLSPGEAFRSFADRCDLEEARELATALLQSERYGASVAKALRGYADSARQDRQLWAEEVAQKAAVKIIFPMLICIFPAIFIVLLGPAAQQMSKLFAK